MGRLSTHERRFAEALQGTRQGRECLCRRQACDAKRSLRALDSAGRARSICARAAGSPSYCLLGAVARPVRASAIRLVSLGASIAWEEIWTMDNSVQPCFRCRPASCSGIGEQTRSLAGQGSRLLGRIAASRCAGGDRRREAEGAGKCARSGDRQLSGGSPYRKMFRDGATLYPRQLCFVERRTVGRLGADPSAPLVASRRTNQEKEPWKSLAGIKNRVEAEFCARYCSAKSILPDRLFKAFEGVVPVSEKGEVLDAESAANRGFDGLHGWMKKAEKIWNGDRPRAD